MIKIIVNRDHFKGDLVVAYKNKKYLNLPLLFPKCRFGAPLQFILRNKNVEVFYEYKFVHNLIPLFLPRYLEVNKEFLVGLGIYLGEGARNRHPKITNSEPTIINRAIKFFKLFNFKNKDFKAWIQLHERSKKSLQQAKNFWIKNTNLTKKNIRSLRIKKSHGNAEVEQYGVLHLEINSILFQLLINNLLEFVPGIIKILSKRQLIWFLQGAYAGEGYVGITKSKSVNQIGYTSIKKEERTLIKQILNKFKIKVSENNHSGDLDICGYYNIKKVYDLNLFKYHLIRKKRLEEGLKILEKSHIPWFNKLRIIQLLKNGDILTTLEISRYLNLSTRNTFNHLDKLCSMKLIKKIKNLGSIQNKWFI